MLLEEPQRHCVPGDHKSMLREPNARVLAEVLSQGIEAALRASGGEPVPAIPAGDASWASGSSPS
jgi:hypothetical protein